MMYFYDSYCISPQREELDELQLSKDNWLTAIEPTYDKIPRGVLRRMGKAVRMGVGAALPLIEHSSNLGGIIIGTANGGMEDCIRFLNQIVEYNEGNLTPTNFVQSTTNAIAGQIGLMAQNTAYNATHVHRGLAFENALLDAFFISSENPKQAVLVGGIDEISTYNYNIDLLSGWYKKDAISNDKLFESKTEGSLAGEGVAMFTIGQQSENAVMELVQLKTAHTRNPEELTDLLKGLKEEYNISTVFSGENGDSRILPFYEQIENTFDSATVCRYKHLCGEYPTTTAYALWLAMKAFQENRIPTLLNMKRGEVKEISREEHILIYNAYQGYQHSFILVKGC